MGCSSYPQWHELAIRLVHGCDRLLLQPGPEAELPRPGRDQSDSAKPPSPRAHRQAPGERDPTPHRMGATASATRYRLTAALGYHSCRASASGASCALNGTRVSTKKSDSHRHRTNKTRLRDNSVNPRALAARTASQRTVRVRIMAATDGNIGDVMTESESQKRL